MTLRSFGGSLRQVGPVENSAAKQAACKALRRSAWLPAILPTSFSRTYSHDQIGKPIVPHQGCRTITASVTPMCP